MGNSHHQNRNDQEQELLKQIAEDNDVDIELLQELLEYERTCVHLERRRGAKSDIQHTIERWIEEQEV